MGHILIFIYIIGLMIGIWAFQYSYQMYKLYKIALLRWYKNFILYYLILLSIILYYKYMYTNIFSIPLYPIWNIIEFLVISGMTYFFLRVVFEIHGKPVSRYIPIFLFGIFLIFSVFFIISITMYLSKSTMQYLMLVNLCTKITALLIIILFLLRLLYRLKSYEVAGKRKSLKAFGYLYLTGYTLPVFVFLLSYPLDYYLFSSLFLLLNLCHLIWLKWFFHDLAIKSIQPGELSTNLEIVFQKYNISRREQEIVNLILQGKSNKEIEEELFISIKTVKNHVYNIFQKFGIKSRGQLVNFILTSQKQL